MKKCATCKLEKQLITFGKNKSTKDGLHTECKACRKDYRIRNLEARKAYEKEYDASRKEQKQDYYLANKIRINNTAKIWQKENQALLNQRKRERRKTDISFKLADNLRTRIRQIIKGNIKSGSAVSDLGCSIDFFKQYIEQQFQKGMSWNNYGAWHIDHIIPLAFFDLNIREQFLQACHYTNLQPLWAKDNLSKGCKLNYGVK